MASFQTSGEIAKTWGVAAGYGVTDSPSPDYFDPMSVNAPDTSTSSPASKSWYAWAMLGLAAVAAVAVLKGK